MPPRRNSTNATPIRVPPRPSGSGGDKRPLSLVTGQQGFRSSTAMTVETESPVSETSPQELPPMPPRPPPSHLPPGSGALRRRSTRRDSHETPRSALEENDPRQPPRMTIMPQISEPPPPVPTQPRRPAPGGGVGGFAQVPSPPHRSSSDYPHHNTTDYAYRFDTPPSSPHLDSDLHEFAGISGGVHAKVWPTYNKFSETFDKKRLKKWNADLDVLLLFAALFSAIVTAFLITALDDLGPDYQQQTALLLHQLLNGRDPKLANISDPTISFKPSGFAIAVNSLWFASLSTSLGAAFGAMICKEWLAEYNNGTNPVDLLRACQRQIRFMAFQRWDFDALVALLPPLLHSSIMLFFAGAVVYLWEIDEMVGIVYQVIGGIFVIAYFLSTFLPLMVHAPFRPYSMLHFHRLFVAMKNIIISIVDVFVHACYLTLRYVTGAILFPFARTIFNDKTFHHWYMYAAEILPGEYKHMRAWRAKPSNNSVDKIDTSQRVQEEAILWLSQMPLDPSESKDVVSSLALISSRPHKFPSQAIMLLNLALESSLREGIGREQTDLATDCVLVLGHIKFQSAVDQNSDRDHNVGGIPISASVAWAAQQFTISAFREKVNTPHAEGTRVRLLTAAAWLSPVDPTEDVHRDSGEKLKIQDRYQFIEEIRTTLMRHIHGEKVLDNKVLINLIHGMHACIPRGDYGYASAVVSFLPFFCEDYDSPWSEDESVVRALITYALDLLLPPGREWPLVEREIEFDTLASELIDTLMVKATSIEVVTFGFWFVYRVPYAFKSRKTMLADVGHIWTSAIEPIGDDALRHRLNFYAVDALTAVAQYHVSTSGALPKLPRQTTLRLFNTVLESDYTSPMMTYMISMILNLGKSTQAAAVTKEVGAERFIEILFSVKDDLEKGMAEEDVVDLHIYSTLVLLKLQPSVELDVEKVKGFIGRMERTIGDPSIRDAGVASRKTEADIIIDLDRVRWKAIYLSALLLKFVPDNEMEKHADGLRTRVRMLVGSGGLSLVGDYEHCLQPLGMELELRTPIADQRGPINTAYEVWIDGFPLFPLAGSVTSAKA